MTTIEALPVWTWRPNWANGIIESLEWLTDIMSSETFAEQRRGLRLSPRRGFEVSINPKGQERSLFHTAMMSKGASDWYVPIWYDVEVIGSEVTSGSTEVVIDTLHREFFPSTLAMFLGETAFDYEVVSIEEVTETSIKFTSPTTRTWPIGTRLYPVRQSRLRTQIESVRKKTENLAQIPVAFDFIETEVNPLDQSGWGYLWGYNWSGGGNMPPWAITAGWGRSWGFAWGGTTSSTGFGINGYPIYYGYPVLTTRPNEREDLSSGFVRKVVDMDNDVGLVYRTDTANRAMVRQQYMWMLRRRVQHAEIRALLYYLRGRLVPLWVPTFYSDIVPAESITLTYELKVKRAGLFTFGIGPGREHIMIERRSGPPLFNRIVNVGQDGSNDVLFFDYPFETMVDFSDIRRVSFMELSRQDQDRIEIMHHTSNQGVSEISTLFVSAPNIRQAISV